MAQTPQAVIDGLPPRFRHDPPLAFARAMLGRRTLLSDQPVCAHCGQRPTVRRHVCFLAIEDWQRESAVR